MYRCANCTTYVCQVGDQEHGPEYCPMHGDFPATDALYADPNERRIARLAAVIEGIGYRRWTRAEEIIEFAHGLDISRLGLAFCPSMKREAEIYADVLKVNGFEVVLGTEDHDSAHKGEPCLEGGLDSCNPVAQAELFNRRRTGLNILFGLCVGYDSLFIGHSQGLVTCLVAKDQILAHNPVAALYQVNSYFKTTLYQHHKDDTPLPDCLTPEFVVQMQKSYSDINIRRLAIAAAQVVSLRHTRWSRVEETIELARRLQATRLGLVFCIGLRNEAKIMASILERNGFEVISAGCKTGAVPKEMLGISDSEKVHPGKPEMICNPIAQAVLLNRSQTELNILMGQCVGHDCLTMKYAKAPVICLIAKDRVLAHNTIGAIHAANGYFYEALYVDHRPS